MTSAFLRASVDGTVSAAVVWLVCRCVPKLGAAARTWLWWLVAAQFAVAVAFGAPITLRVLPSRPPSAPALSTPLPQPPAPGIVNSATHERSTGAGETASTRAIESAGTFARSWRLSAVLPWLVAFWTIGVTCAVSLGVRDWRRARAILSRSRPAPADVRATVADLALRLHLRRVPVVRIGDLATTPVLVGARRPTVVLPGRSLTSLSSDAQRLAIAHELAHVKRLDLPLGWLPALVEAVFFFHPFARLAAREYALSREAACDALVLRRLQAEPASYGRMLIALGVTRPYRGFSIAGASWSSAILKRRLVMLNETPPPMVWRALAGALTALAVVVILPFRLAARPAVSTPSPTTSPAAVVPAAPAPAHDNARTVVASAEAEAIVPDVASHPPAPARAQQRKKSFALPSDPVGRRLETKPMDAGEFIALPGPQPTSPAVPAAKQTTSSAANTRFAQTDLVLVDVGTRDAAGQPVLDIRPDELQVFEDGVQQTIETFTLTSGSGSTRYYVVGYRSTNQGTAPGFRAIQVRVNRPGVAVQFRKGYYVGQDDFTRGAYPEDSPDLVNPVVREQREAKYTANAMRAKIQGVAVVEAVVGVDGRVDRVRVAQSLDATYGLDEQALIAARQWTFTPGELKGERVPVLVRLMVSFRLH